VFSKQFNRIALDMSTQEGGVEEMSKKAFRFMIPCVCGTLALLLLLSGPYFGLMRAEPPQQQPAARTAPAASADARKTIQIKRAPARVIRDPNSSFSAVAVDVAHNEIVLQDENLAQIMVYDRTENTPPRAALSEPKRIIGGSATKVAMNCGVYVDPVSGDIYNVNGDTEDWLTVWSRDKKGNVPPTRELETPHRTFGVVVDEEAKELFVTIQHPPAVIVWSKTAQGKDAPIRILEGEKTLLAEAQGVAVDTKNQLLYVSNQGAYARHNNNTGWSRALKPGSTTWEIPDRILDLIPGTGQFHEPSINVYPLKAGGDTPPLRMIQGPKAGLNWPTHISVDVDHQELYVANPVTHEILVFNTSASGNVAPIRVLKGSQTGLAYPQGVFVDTKNDELVVANFGNHSSTIYRRTAAGNTAPIRTIRSAPPNAPAPMFGNIGAASYDTKRNEFLTFN
jgi:DNA-binding beta-propeller fold protein YncE